MNALRLHGITMSYGRNTLFHEIEAEVRPGQCLVITGTNGAGKSSLLKIIAGLLRPESGTVKYDGRLGWASPDVQLYGELTGAENLAFFGNLLRTSPAGYETLLAQVGLPQRRGQDLVSAYSSGMRQRLKLAVSLLGSPQLLLWDEPTAMLDATGRATVGEILLNHRANGGLAVIATNDPVEAQEWGDLRLMIGA